MTTIKLKNGSGAPLATDLVQGEVALDLTNKRIYSENASGTVIEMGTSPSTIDINAGTIDGVTMATSDITVGAGKTLDVSAGTLTLANDQISGDKVQGGTIGSTTITTLTSTTGNITTVNATTVDTTNIEVTNVKAKDGTASATIADSTGVMTIASSVLTTTDINSGTIDGVTIGGASAGAGTFTTLQANTSLNVDGTVTADGLVVQNTSDLLASGVGDYTAYAQQFSVGAGNNTAQGLCFTNNQDVGAAIVVKDVGTNQISDMYFYTKASTVAAANPLLRQSIASNGDISFYEDTGTTPKLFWDASAESLGIGTVTPSLPLSISYSDATAIPTNDISGPTTGAVQIYNTSDSAAYSGIYLRTRTTSATSGMMGLRYNTAFNDGDIFFRIRNGAGTSIEPMTLKASGNVGIGTTSPGARIEATASGAAVQILNRTTSDGNILEFEKDGTTVGSIGTGNGSDFYITGTPALTGLRFQTDEIVPVNATGANKDAAIDLGKSNIRFKDLYLSGSVYLGGTTSANALDDYEEGLHTATLTCSTSGTITLSNDALSYTKIGRVVHLQGRLTVTSVSSPVGGILLSLPFAIANTSEDSARTVGYVQIQNATSSLNSFGFYPTESGSSIALIVTGGNTSETTGESDMAAEFSGNEFVSINLTYITT